MEIIFLLISVILTVIFIYLLGRTVHDTHSSLVRALKRSEEEVVRFLKWLPNDHGHKYNTELDAWNDFKQTQL